MQESQQFLTLIIINSILVLFNLVVFQYNFIAKQAMNQIKMQSCMHVQQLVFPHCVSNSGVFGYHNIHLDPIWL